MESLWAVGRALDRAEQHGATLARSIGEHINDPVTSLYVQTPSGVQIESGCNGQLVDDATWTVGHYSSASSWGHEPTRHVMTSLSHSRMRTI